MQDDSSDECSSPRQDEQDEVLIMAYDTPSPLHGPPSTFPANERQVVLLTGAVCGSKEYDA